MMSPTVASSAIMAREAEQEFKEKLRALMQAYSIQGVMCGMNVVGRITVKNTGHTVILNNRFADSSQKN